jgi:hypothetical protein
MQRGVVCLGILYDLVREIVANNPDTKNQLDAYRVNGSSPHSKDYRKKCRDVLSASDVPNEQGFYLWGFYNRSGFWINVYCGKAGKGKTADLRDRLYKELTAENASIWREVNPDNARVLSIGEQIHPTMWYKYKTHWERALNKAGSTHIFWVATPESELKPENVESVENDLIEAMNPTGNRQRRLPAARLQQDAGKIFGAFREMIHLENNRSSKFHLKYHDEFWKWVGRTEPSMP